MDELVKKMTDPNTSPEEGAKLASRVQEAVAASHRGDAEPGE
jgi:hypothetical protein